MGVCNHEKCISSASFNFIEEKIPRWCSIHKKENMINLKHKKCLFKGCRKTTTYGIPGKDKVPMWCLEHADKSIMKNIKHKKCVIENCDLISIYNFPNEISGIYCKTHRLPGTEDVDHKHYECKKCNLRWRQTRKDQELCRYCDPTKRQKSKENEIKKLLEKHNLSFVNDKTFENSCCLKYRPDFIFDCGSFFLVLEVDEYAHSSYPKECETIRMNNISFALGLPVKFIRYNPDNKEFSKDHKETVLVEIVKDLISKEIIEDLEPVYLFYTK